MAQFLGSISFWDESSKGKGGRLASSLLSRIRSGLPCGILIGWILSETSCRKTTSSSIGRPDGGQDQMDDDGRHGV